MEKPRVLAVCIHNSARSQMTEEYLRKYGGDFLEVESAGIEPGTVNPVVAELLLEEGIDIRDKRTKNALDLFRAGRSFEYVIAVCDPEAAERCPVFPAEKKRLHWPFPDPSKASGSMEEKKAYVRPIRDQIRAKVLEFIEELKAESGPR